MRNYTVQAAKTHLSSILHEVEQGQEAVISRGRVPVARLVPVSPVTPRRFGQVRFEVPDDFDQPLPDDELAAWE